MVSGAAHPNNAEHSIAFNTMQQIRIRRTTLEGRNHRGKEFTSNAMAIKAAEAARAKGWKTWTELDQSDVLDWATTVAQVPNTNWYFIGQWVEDDEEIYKVCGNQKEVLTKWLAHCNAYPDC